MSISESLKSSSAFPPLTSMQVCNDPAIVTCADLTRQFEYMSPLGRPRAKLEVGSRPIFPKCSSIGRFGLRYSSETLAK